MQEMKLFALNASRDWGERVAGTLGVTLGAHEEREFEDGEHKARPLENVRERDVYVIHSLFGDARQSVNDKLVRLLLFIGALKDASAARVTAVIPYLCYARKDRKTKPRDPTSTRYVAGLLEAVGVDRVVTLDVHNLAAYQNAFRIPTEHLEAKQLFVEHVVTQIGNQEITVVSPDIGGTKRAEAFRQTLERRLGRATASAFMEKQRSAGVVSGEALVGDVAGRTVVIIDDMISSGTTLSRTAAACRAGGAVRVLAAASHGVFASQANEVLADPALEQIVVTDSVPPLRLHSPTVRDKLVILDSAPLFAEAIRRIHGGGSIVALLEG